MAENSKIAWTDHTFNPWIGCTRVSPGCENCYAENLMDHRYGRVKWGPGQARSRTKTWSDPLKWNRLAEKTGERKRVFCASLADWLDAEVPGNWFEDLCDLIEQCKHLDWLMLTKRPENAKAMLPPKWIENPRPWVWFGVTAENQKYYDLRVPTLKAIPAALRWVSYEPALGPINVQPGIDWLIIGGESAQMEPAREFEMEWAIDAVEQSRAAGVVPFVKQLGSNVTFDGNRIPFRDKAGADPREWPSDLRIRDFPMVAS